MCCITIIISTLTHCHHFLTSHSLATIYNPPSITTTLLRFVSKKLPILILYLLSKHWGFSEFCFLRNIQTPLPKASWSWRTRSVRSFRGPIFSTAGTLPDDPPGIVIRPLFSAVEWPHWPTYLHGPLVRPLAFWVLALRSQAPTQSLQEAHHAIDSGVPATCQDQPPRPWCGACVSFSLWRVPRCPLAAFVSLSWILFGWAQCPREAYRKNCSRL